MPGDCLTLGVEEQIEGQHVDARLPQDAEPPALCVLTYERLYLRFGHATCSGYAWHLKLGSGWRDMRVQAAS